MPISSRADEYGERKEEDEIRVIVLTWTAERGNEGERDSHLGVVYWAGPQGALQINLSLTRGANHNFKASLRPISPWPWGQTHRQPLRMASPLDSLEMDVVFLSDMPDVRVLISAAKKERSEHLARTLMCRTHTGPLQGGQVSQSSVQSRVLGDCAVLQWLFSLLRV